MFGDYNTDSRKSILFQNNLPIFQKNRLEHRPTYYILKDNYSCTVSYIVVNGDDRIEWRIDTAK